MSTRQFYPPTSSRLLVKRNGGSILRSAAVPKPTVLIDTREQLPLPLFQRHPNWIAGERIVGLPTADYSVEGMEEFLALERKSLIDLLGCISAHRVRFLAVCARLATFRWKAILVEASYEDIKSGWPDLEVPTEIHPNAVVGALDAIEAKFGIPIIYTSTNRDLATERAASWLSKHFTYWWLEKNGHSRLLDDADGL